MAGKSAIEWTEMTWNPVTGCDSVSPGCDHCYAMTLASRLNAMGNPRYQKDGYDKRLKTITPGFGVQTWADKLEEPLRRRKPTVYFVNSMSDLFHPEVPDDFIREVFNVMRRCNGLTVAATGKKNPSHIFQVLTKRPRRMMEMAQSRKLGYDPLSPPSNVWLGTSVEDQKRAELRIPLLLKTPAAVRFLSAEPLLGPIDFRWMSGVGDEPGWRERGESQWEYDSLKGIHWVIAGGESGPGYRPMQPEWVRTIRDQCQEAETAFFFKQWGGRTPKAGGRELDGRTWDQMPQQEVAA